MTALATIPTATPFDACLADPQHHADKVAKMIEGKG